MTIAVFAPIPSVIDPGGDERERGERVRGQGIREIASHRAGPGRGPVDFRDETRHKPAHLERILSAGDDRIAAFRGVRDAELVRAQGQFIAEGRLVVRRVIEDGRYRVRSVLLNDAARRALAASLEKLPAEVPVYVCDTSAFVELTGYHIHRGCLALVDRPPAMPLPELLAARSSLVVLEAVANADNVGGVFRNVAALGAGGIVLSPTCCDPFYRKAIRTSMGAVFGVPFARASDWPADIARMRAAGFTTVALTPQPPAETLQTFGRRARPGRLALILGTEGAGVSPAVESMADHRVRIPIRAAVDSLNVSVAAAIALWALVGDHC